MVATKLALPHCSLPMWEHWPGLFVLFVFFFTKLISVDKLVILLSKSCSPIRCSFTGPVLTLPLILFVYSGTSQLLKSAITSCWLILHKEMLAYVSDQAESLEQRILVFPPPVTSCESRWLMGDSHARSQVFSTLALKFRPKELTWFAASYSNTQKRIRGTFSSVFDALYYVFTLVVMEWLDCGLHITWDLLQLC